MAITSQSITRKARPQYVVSILHCLHLVRIFFIIRIHFTLTHNFEHTFIVQFIIPCIAKVKLFHIVQLQWPMYSAHYQYTIITRCAYLRDLRFTPNYPNCTIGDHWKHNHDVDHLTIYCSLEHISDCALRLRGGFEHVHAGYFLYGGWLAVLREKCEEFLWEF